MCLFQPCLQQFHYMIPFLSGDAFKLAKSLPSNLNFCFPLLSFMDAVPLIVTIFVLLPVSPSLLSVFPLLTIPLENLMPPHPGPWWAHSHLSTLSTLHPHFMLSKQPKSHKLPSEWVEPVSLARLKIPGGKTPVSVLFRSHIGRGKSRIEGKLRIGREGGVNLPSERWSGVSWSSTLSFIRAMLHACTEDSVPYTKKTDIPLMIYSESKALLSTWLPFWWYPGLFLSKLLLLFLSQAIFPPFCNIAFTSPTVSTLTCHL